MNKLNKKIAVVTGGNSGIGLATAKEFVAEGAEVIITGRNKESVEKSAGDIHATGLVSDQGNLKDIEDLVSTIKNRFGKIDILFINAGVAALAPFENITEDQFDSNMDTNFKGAFFKVQKFLPLPKEGFIVT